MTEWLDWTELNWKKSYDKHRWCIRKQSHHFADKGLSTQIYGFSSSHVWMWQLDHKATWVLKNWCFWIWCSRRLWRVPWTARRSNQSVLKEINPEYSLEGLMLKLKVQNFGHRMWRADTLEITWMLGKTEGRRRMGWQQTRWLDGIIDSMGTSLSKLQEIVKDREGWHAAVNGVTKSQTWLSDWLPTTMNEMMNSLMLLLYCFRVYLPHVYNTSNSIWFFKNIFNLKCPNWMILFHNNIYQWLNL